MLLLFDIDGTLLRGGAEAHREALLRAVRTVHHVQVADLDVETAGRTDAWITRALLLNAGVDAKAIDDGVVDVRDAAVAAYVELCPDDLSQFVIDGVPGALESLAGDHTLALVTGNIEAIAHHKLRRAGIGHHFVTGQGGFGSDAEDRTELPAIARARAGDHPRSDTVVIGDTPHDVACARFDGVRCIGVTTGPFNAHDLAGADHVIDSVSGLPALL